MIRRFILVALGVIVVLMVAIAIGLYWFLSGDRVRIALERQATKWLGQPVAIGSAGARIFPRPAITLHDVRAGDPVRIVLANVEVSTGLRALWSRRIEDAEVAASGSRIDMPLPFTLPAPGGASAAAPTTDGGLQIVS